MEWDRRWVRTRGSDQLAILQVGECALDGASGESCGAGDGLMRCAHRPVGLLGCPTIEVKVNDERGQAAVMADQVGQEAVEQVRVKSHLYHALV
jgi:hypothetical protein